MPHLKTEELLVMLVEPSSTQQRIVKRQLETLGVKQILGLDSGAEALNEMPNYQPDVVISAMYLPDMNGTDLVHAMRNDARLSDMAFMLISSETRFRYLDPIRQAGAVAILPKPFDLGDLKIALKSTLDFIDPETIELSEFDVDTLDILVVDDSAMARKHIIRILTAMGVEHIREATDGQEAVQMLGEHYFDLVITDYNMPHMDGKELVDYIRQQSGQSSLPVLMVTSEEDEQRLASVQQAGVSAVCDKPFDPTTVRMLIQQMLAQ